MSICFSSLNYGRLGRVAKMMEKKQAAQAAAAQKQAISAEEDTFRGVHLDPNAHHWDEVCLLHLYGTRWVNSRAPAIDGRR